VFFLRSVPAGGNDLLLELACVTAGAVMGCLSGWFTHLRRDRDGQVLGHAGWVPAGLWVAGVGARMAFVFAATHGLGTGGRRGVACR
jgi:tryptophan synthase beta subunit